MSRAQVKPAGIMMRKFRGQRAHEQGEANRVSKQCTLCESMGFGSDVGDQVDPVGN
jgi:hypothetical protein